MIAPSVLTNSITNIKGALSGMEQFEKSFWKNHTQNVVEKLFPGSFLKNKYNVAMASTQYYD